MPARSRKFGERGILDTIGLMGHYSLIGMVLNTARTPVEPGEPPLLEKYTKVYRGNPP